MANKKYLRRILGCFLSLALLISSATSALAEAFDTSAMSPIEKVNYYGDFEHGLNSVFYVNGAESEVSSDAYAGNGALKITTNNWGGIFVQLDLKANTQYTISVKAKIMGSENLYPNFDIQDRSNYTSISKKQVTVNTSWTSLSYTFTTVGANEYRVNFGGFKSGYTICIDDFALYSAADLTSGASILRNGSFEYGNMVGFNASNASKFSLSSDMPYSGDKCLAIAGSSGWENLSQTITVEPNTDYALSLFARTENKTSSGALYKVLAPDNTTSLVGGDKEMSTFASGDWKRNLVTFNSGSNTSIKFYLVCKPTATFVDDITLTKVSDFGGNEVNLINPGFEDLDKGLAAWSNNTVAKITDEPYSGDWALNIIGDSSDKWSNTVQKFFAEPNTDYVISFYAKRTVEGNAALCKVLGGGANLLSNDNWMIGSENIGEWVYNVMSFNSGNNTLLDLVFVRNACGAVVDDIHIGKKATVNVSATQGGSVEKSIAIVGIGDKLTLWATAETGYEFTGWYSNDALLSTDAAYTHTVSGDAAIEARFAEKTINIAEISDPGFEQSTITGWSKTDIFELVSSDAHSGNQAVRIKGQSEIARWSNSSLTFEVEPNSDYVVHFYGKREDGDNSFTLVHVMAGSDKLVGDVGINGLQLSDGSFDHSQWGLNEIEFNSGANRSVKLVFQVSLGASYVDDIYIAKKINVAYTSNNKDYGTVTASSSLFAYGEQYTLTAVPAGKAYIFNGWYDENNTLVYEGETYTGTGEANLTAVFEKVIIPGDVNGDGDVTTEDMVLIRKALLGVEQIDETAADAYTDGEFNIKDLIHVKKILAKKA